MRILLVVTLLVCLAACASKTTTKPSTEAYLLGQLNVVTINNEPVVLNSSDQFAWQGELLFSGDEKLTQEEDIKQRIKQAITRQFEMQGLVFNEDIASADYLLVGVVLLDGYQQDPKHADLLFGLDPGMKNQDEYGLGTLLIGIKSVNTGGYVWRGAVQVLTSANDALPAEVRKARLHNAIRALFKGFLEQRAITADT